MNSDEAGSVSEAQISVKLPNALKDRISALCKDTEITPGALLRRLGEMAAAFYETHGEFSFPGLTLTKSQISNTGKTDPSKKNPGVSRKRMKELRESGLNAPFNPAESSEREAAERSGVTGSTQRFSTPAGVRAKANQKRGGRTVKPSRKKPHNTKPTKLDP